MKGTTAYDGACECGGLIEADKGDHLMEELNRTTTNQVRNVLMNELGLTRETVRKMTEELVADTIKKHFNSGAMDAMVNKQIRDTVDGILKERSWFAPGAAKTFITGAVEAHLRKVMGEVTKAMSGKVSVKLNVDFDGKECGDDDVTA